MRRASAAFALAVAAAFAQLACQSVKNQNQPNDANAGVAQATPTATPAAEHPLRRQMEEEARQSPDDPNSHFNLGNVYLQEGRFEEAIAEYQKVILADPNDADTHGQIG